MKSLHLRVHVDEYGQVTLSMPEELANQEVDLVVVFAPVEQAGTDADATSSAYWPNGFYEATAGAWQGEPLVRETERNYEARDPLE